MKSIHILSLLALATCALSVPARADDSSFSPTLGQRASDAYDQAKQAAIDAKNAVNAKLTDWKLTPSDIKTDLEKTGRVVRDKTVSTGKTVGTAASDAGIVTLIKAKFVADRDLAAWQIHVSSDHGIVTLTGTVKSAELDGRAIALALDTDGTTRVVSLLHISPTTE